MYSAGEGRKAIPRYYFDVRDGEDCPDLEGTVLPDDGAMRSAALRFVADLLAEEVMRRDLGEHWRLVVRDETGEIVLRLDIKDR